METPRKFTNDLYRWLQSLLVLIAGAYGSKAFPIINLQGVSAKLYSGGVT